MKGKYSMENRILKYILKIPKEENNLVTKRKAYLINFSILILLFITITTLCITEGWLKLSEYEEYARTVENSNITTIMGPVLLIGPAYTFLGTLSISFIMKFIKHIDWRIKGVLKKLPIFVTLFTIPAWLMSSFIVQSLHMIQ